MRKMALPLPDPLEKKADIPRSGRQDQYIREQSVSAGASGCPHGPVEIPFRLGWSVLRGDKESLLGSFPFALGFKCLVYFA